MSETRQAMIDDFVAGALSGKSVLRLMDLCAQDQDFRQAVVAESQFSQLIRLTVQRINADSETSEFVTRCADAFLDGTSPVQSRYKADTGRMPLKRWVPLALAASLLLAVGSWWMITGHKASVIGQVVSTTPGVSLWRDGQAIPVTKGTRVRAGDELVTGPKQGIAVSYSDDASRVELGFNTRFAIRHSKLGRLQVGHVMAEVSHQDPKRPFVLETPHARATVLGTRLHLGAKGNLSRLDVFRGRVRFERQTDALDVAENEYAIAEAGVPLAALPKGTDYTAYARLRRHYRDERVVFEDNFEGPAKGWLPIVSADSGISGVNQKYPALKKGTEVPQGCVGVDHTDMHGKKSRVLRIMSEGANNLVYGAWGEYSQLLRPYSVEMKITRIPGLPTTADHAFRGVLAGYKSPPHRPSRNLLNRASCYSIPDDRWANARMEYVMELDEQRNVILDTKVFFDGHLSSWFATKGLRSEFGGEILLSAANGGILVDDIVIRRMVPPRVTEGLLALYRFDEGKGTTIRDISGIGDPLHLTIGRPDAAHWLSDGLLVTDDARIRSGPAGKIAEAWRKSGHLALEMWVRPFIDEPMRPKETTLVKFNSRRSSFGFQQIAPSSHNTPRKPLHYVLLLKTDKDVVRARFFQDNIQRSDDPPGGLPQTDHLMKTEETASRKETYLHRVTESTVGLEAANQALAVNSLKLRLQGDNEGQATWTGEYYMIAIYDHELTPNEIWRNYLAGPPIAPFDGKSEQAGLLFEDDFESDSGRWKLGIWRDGRVSIEKDQSNKARLTTGTYGNRKTRCLKLTAPGKPALAAASLSNLKLSGDFSIAFDILHVKPSRYSFMQYGEASRETLYNDPSAKERRIRKRERQEWEAERIEFREKSSSKGVTCYEIKRYMDNKLVEHYLSRANTIIQVYFSCATGEVAIDNVKVERLAR